MYLPSFYSLCNEQSNWSCCFLASTISQSNQPHQSNLAAYLSLHSHNTCKKKKKKPFFFVLGNRLIFFPVTFLISLPLKIVPFLGNLKLVGFSFGWGDSCNWFLHLHMQIEMWMCVIFFLDVCFCDLAFDLCTILECILFYLFNFHGLIEYCMLMVLVAFELLNFLASVKRLSCFCF